MFYDSICASITSNTVEMFFNESLTKTAILDLSLTFGNVKAVSALRIKIVFFAFLT